MYVQGSTENQFYCREWYFLPHRLNNYIDRRYAPLYSRGVARPGQLPGHQLTLPGHQHYILSKKWRQTRVESIALTNLIILDGLSEF